jgi:cobalt-zinc-cadmium efflux system membrane fusion protein
MKKYIVALSLFGLTACHHAEVVSEQKDKNCLSDSALNLLQTDSVKFSSLDDELTLSGEIGFDENKVVKVFPRNSGQIIESKISLGDKVIAGQPLAHVKSAEVAGNYADVASANADVLVAKRAFENQESLYKSGIASEKDLNEAKQNYEKAKAAKNKIESLLAINGGEHSKPGGVYTITAPISGYIVEKKMNEGNFIRPDMGDYLYTISDLQDVWVSANIYELDIPRVKVGYDVEVRTLSYPDKVFTGKIEKISEVLDPVTKTLRARIRLQNKDMMLKPEMFAKVLVRNKTANKLLCIPSSAIIDQNGKNYVVVFKDKCNMHIQEIEISKVEGDKTYIKSGLVQGDRLIVKNQILVFQKLLNL